MSWDLYRPRALPGVVRPGSTCTEYVQQVDFLATVAELLRLNLPPNMGEDSFTLLPLLTGSGKGTRTSGINQSFHGLFAIRQGPWKLIFGQGSGGWAKGFDTKAEQLYQVDEDPTEARNVIDEHRAKVKELTELMRTIVADGRSTVGPPEQNDVAIDWRKFIGTTEGR